MDIGRGTGKRPGRSTLLLAGALVLLGGLFAWNAVNQWQAERTAGQLQLARDAVVTGTADAVRAHQQEMARQLELPAVKAAAAAGDMTAFELAFRDGMRDVEDVKIYPARLGDAYADPAAFGWSRLALLEQAVLDGQAAVRVVKDAGAPRLGVAAPIQFGEQPSLVYIRLQLPRLTAALDGAVVPEAAYLGLRQGGYTVVEQGQRALGSGGEAMARAVPDTGLRVVAALPEVSAAPLGLGALSCAVVALLLFLVAVLALLGPSRLPVAAAVKRRRKPAEPEEQGATLREAMQEHIQAQPEVAAVEAPPPVAVVPAINVAAGMFRAYDIRGVVGRDLNGAVAEMIGQAIGSELIERGLRDIVVGRDGRLSGPELSAGLIEGLRNSGCEVHDIGLAPSPVAYFAAYHLRAGSCVVVTGSHNPPEYNGFKIVLGGETLSGEAITALHTRIAEGRLLQAAVPGSVQQHDVTDAYIQRIAGDVQLERPLKVVADAGNGVAGMIAPALLEAIGAEVIPLYCDVDGEFPNHHPDPSDAHNLEDLVATVKRFGADLGVAFDGDGDRLGVVTAEGRLIHADRLLMLFAADVLMRNPGAQVIYDVKCSGKLSDFVLRNGGSPLMWKTGHSLIKAKMRQTDAELAGEMSGHFFFKERWYGFDDGLYAAARLLEILAQREETMEEVLEEIPDPVSTPEIKVAVEEGTQHALVTLFTAAAQVQDSEFFAARLSTVDGLRADFPDGWGLLRASNTTPALVLRFEGDDQQALDRIRDIFRRQLAQLLPEAADSF
ncbi:phosphomannomutase [Stenotrophomonas ginsengisoli]|uniref:phosphomannomutase n=1 Tax=Stenotrophomonas ginsengisoli TaxID=336566 RepID=A0A0R0DJ31_9GAMM|nr:phosphomannomutase/phosphoglucomutase [Stenotrophomonas ginsengisoli]KRG77924.1 phosphomannomutase [Stenotrophomonas ginsengisoli]